MKAESHGERHGYFYAPLCAKWRVRYARTRAPICTVDRHTILVLAVVHQEADREARAVQDTHEQPALLLLLQWSLWRQPIFVVARSFPEKAESV